MITLRNFTKEIFVRFSRQGGFCSSDSEKRSFYGNNKTPKVTTSTVMLSYIITLKAIVSVEIRERKDKQLKLRTCLNVFLKRLY